MIKNIDGLSVEQINLELQKGARFIIFGVCYSYVACTTHGYSKNVFFVKKDESTLKYAWPYILLALFLGWWGLPWGFIYTPWALYVNFTGGRDVTAEIIQAINEEAEQNGII